MLLDVKYRSLCFGIGGGHALGDGLDCFGSHALLSGLSPRVAEFVKGLRGLLGVTSVQDRLLPQSVGSTLRRLAPVGVDKLGN